MIKSEEKNSLREKTKGVNIKLSTRSLSSLLGKKKELSLSNKEKFMSRERGERERK